jgi:hypothetical protein
MSILSNIISSITNWFNPTPANTKQLNELFQFLTAFPFAQIEAAASVGGTNLVLDQTAANAIIADIINSFYSGLSVQAAAASASTLVTTTATTTANT